MCLRSLHSGVPRDASLAIYGLAADGTWVELPSHVDPDRETILVSPAGFSRFVLGNRAPDVPALSASAWLVLAGLLSVAGAIAVRSRYRPE